MNQEIKEKEQKADILSHNWKAEDNISRELAKDRRAQEIVGGVIKN